MNIGIIGAEEKKFTVEARAEAIFKIAGILADMEITTGSRHTVVSGHCHLGGIDIWAEEVADTQGCPKLIFPPKIYAWEGGYKQRNIEIAKASDVIYVIVVRKLPPGMKADPWNENGCYHCNRRMGKKFDYENVKRAHGWLSPHVKSGACWTAWYAVEKLGKEANWIVI